MNTASDHLTRERTPGAPMTMRAGLCLLIIVCGLALRRFGPGLGLPFFFLKYGGSVVVAASWLFFFRTRCPPPPPPPPHAACSPPPPLPAARSRAARPCSLPLCCPHS